MQRYEELGLLEDEGMISVVQAHPEILAGHPEFAPEPAVQALAVEPLSLYERAVIGFNRHRKGILQLGGLGIGSFAAGAIISRPRHA